MATQRLSFLSNKNMNLILILIFVTLVHIIYVIYFGATLWTARCKRPICLVLLFIRKSFWSNTTAKRID